MANGNLIQQAEKMYQSELDTTDYAKLLTEPAVKAIGDMLKVQRVKTEALMAAMPAGVNISKVPEELRGKVTAYLTENKATYTEAAKVVASGIKPTDQRYIDAIETMNNVRGGFEALDANLVKLAENRKLSLDSIDNISTGANDWSSILHHKFANGEIYKELTLEDGNFYYRDNKGNKINTNDYAGAMQQSTGVTNGMIGQSDRARELGLKGFNFEDEEGNFRGSVSGLLKNAGKNGRVDFAYSGVYGIEETPFIDTYIKENHPPEEYDRWYAHYKNEDFSAGTDMGNKLREYLLGAIRNSYNSGVAAKEKADTEAANKKDKFHDTSYGSISTIRASNFVKKVNNSEEFIMDTRGLDWQLQENGTYALYNEETKKADLNTIRTRAQMIEKNEMDSFYPDIYSGLLDVENYNPEQDADGSQEKPFILQEGEKPTRGKYYKLESGIFQFDGRRYIPVKEE
jgi:hypothetical protein